MGCRVALFSDRRHRCLGIYHSAGFAEPFTATIVEKQGDETRILLRKELDTDHLHLYRSK